MKKGSRKTANGSKVTRLHSRTVCKDRKVNKYSKMYVAGKITSADLDRLLQEHRITSAEYNSINRKIQSARGAIDFEPDDDIVIIPPPRPAQNGEKRNRKCMAVRSASGRLRSSGLKVKEENKKFRCAKQNKRMEE